MTRYEYCDGEMVNREYGDYIRFDDHETAMANKDADLAGLKRELGLALTTISNMRDREFRRESQQ